MSFDYSDVAQYYWGLGDVVSEILEQTGIMGDEIDLGSLTGTVKGFIITNSTAYGALGELGQTHLFDIINADARAIIMPREWAPVFEVPLDDLVIDDNNDYLKVDAATEELPALIHVRYYDVMGGNAQSIQTSENVHMSIGSGEEVLEINELMEGKDAKRLAMIQHKIKAQLAKGKVFFALPKKWVHLTVGDVVILDGIRLRITKCTVDLLKQDYEAMHDRRSAYDADSPPLETPRVTLPPSGVITAPLIAFFDIPDFLEMDELGVYFAVQRTSVDWKGTQIEYSPDGTNFDFWESQYIEGLFGETTSTITAHEREYPDQFNELIVRVDNPSDSLRSLTQRELLNRQGMLLVGKEIISYRDSEMVGDGEFKLTYLLRGRLGTTPQAHSAGVRVISLSQGETPLVEMSTGDLNKTYYMKAEAYEGDGSITETALKLEGNSMKEQAPARVRVIPQGADMRIEWSPVGKKARGGAVELSQYTTGSKVRVGGGAETFVPVGTYHLIVPTSSAAVTVKMTNSIMGDGPSTTGYRRG